jgi:hypothetical protein
MKSLLDKISRRIIDIRYQAVHKKMMAEIDMTQLEPLNTEDEILAAAVSICQKK